MEYFSYQVRHFLTASAISREYLWNDAVNLQMSDFSLEKVTITLVHIYAHQRVILKDIFNSSIFLKSYILPIQVF